MIFHLITIQNQNSDDTVFHGLDYDSLRLQVAAYCREEWHHGSAHAEPLPSDREEQIEAFFHEHDRLFLIEQEFPFDLPEIPNAASLTLPTVHMNGTGFKMLFEGYDQASDQLRHLTDAFGNIEFNARDYYVQGPDAYTQARDERQAIYAKLRDIKHYLEKHLIHLDEQRR